MERRSFLRNRTKFVWSNLLTGIKSLELLSWIDSDGIDNGKVIILSPKVLIGKRLKGYFWVSFDHDDQFPRSLTLHIDFGFFSYELGVDVSHGHEDVTIIDYKKLSCCNEAKGMMQKLTASFIEKNMETFPENVRRYLDKKTWNH